MHVKLIETILSIFVVAVVFGSSCSISDAQQIVVEGTPVSLTDGRIMIVGEKSKRVVILKIIGKANQQTVDFLEGDIINAVNKQKISDMRTFNRVYHEIPVDRATNITVNRNSKSVNVLFKKTKTKLMIPGNANGAGGNWQASDAPANSNQTIKSPDDLQNIVFDLLKHHTAESGPGMVVGVSYQGKTMFSGGAGLANIEQSIQASQSTVMPIASISKQFTGYAIALLAVEGKLDLDKPINNLLPEIKLGKQITIRHLLNHTSGLKDYTGLMSLTGWNYGDHIDCEKILQLMSKQEELNFPPGTQHRYSNTNYALLPIIVERVSGQPFEEYLIQNIFSPLEMRHTFIPSPESEPIDQAANLYQKLPEKTIARFHGEQGAPGSSGIFSTCDDLLKWGNEIINPKRLNANAVKLLTTKSKLNNGELLQYGFGIGSDGYRNQARLSHSGSTRGSSSVLHIYPVHRLVISVLANSDDAEAYRTAESIADVFFPNNKSEKKGNQTGRPAGAMMLTDDDFKGIGFEKGVHISENKIRDIAGRYVLDDGRELITEADGDVLKLKLRHDIPGIPLVHLGSGRFRFAPGRWDISFDLTESPVVKMTVHLSENSIRRGPAGEISGRRRDLEQPTATTLARFCGTYFSAELNTAYDIVMHDKKLYLVHPQMGILPLNYHSGDNFGIPGNKVNRLQFIRSKSDNNKIESLVAEAYAWSATATFKRLK